MKTQIIVLIILLAAGLTSSRAQDTWFPVTIYPGAGQVGAICFTIGDKGYVGTGDSVANYTGYLTKDFWEYDPSLNTWTQKADFTGDARWGAVGFSLGSKGYLGTGFGTNFYHPTLKDFWEYDPSLNTWTRKADFGGTDRLVATSFTIGSMGYVGTGIDYYNSSLKDFWEYDPSIDTWTKKADFPGGERGEAVGFSIGSKGYIGTGGYYKDFWEYDPLLDAWTKKADFGGAARYGAVGFSIGNKGYIGCGANNPNFYNDFWEYDPIFNTWIQKASVPNAEIHVAGIGFNIGNIGYLGLGVMGLDATGVLWQYTPELTPSCAIPLGEITSNISPTSAKLQWNDVADAERYKVRYKVANSSVWTTVTNIKTNKLPVSGLTPNTLYVWEVKSVCSSNPIMASEWSAKQSFTTGTFRMGDDPSVSLDLYPNPVSEDFTLDLQLHSSADQSADIFLLNELGQIVYSEKAVAGNGALKKEITMPSAASSGWYIVRVVLSDQVMEKKLLYQK